MMISLLRNWHHVTHASLKNSALWGLLLALILGIFCAAKSPQQLPKSLSLSLTFLCLCGFILFWQHKSLRYIFWLLFAAILGYARMTNPLLRADTPWLCRGTWQVIDFPRPRATYGQRLTIQPKTSDCPPFHAPIHASFFSRQKVQLGQVFTATLAIHATRHGFYTTLKSPHWQPISPTFSLYTARRLLSAKIEQRFSPANAAWLEAMLLGNQAQLSVHDRQILRYSGTSHLLAVSGLHIAILIGLIFFCVQFLWGCSMRLSIRFPPRSAAFLLSAAAGFLYVLLTGAHTPVIRAWLMIVSLGVFWFLPKLTYRFSGLMLAAVIVLLYSPAALFSLSAWLSFLATAAVIALWARVQHASPLTQWIVIQFGVSLCLLPLVWAVFGGISLSGFFINLLVIPWLAPLILLCYSALFIPALAPFANAVFGAYHQAIIHAAQFSWAYWRFPWQPTLLTGALLSAALLLLIVKYIKSSAVLMLIALATACYTLRQTTLYRAPVKAFVAIIMNRQQTLVINAGYHHHQRDDAKRYLIPQLKAHARRPDAILITNQSLYANSALNSLLTVYPQTPVYTLVKMPNFPFAHSYCPQQAVAGLRFRENQGCEVRVNKHLKITTAGIEMRQNGQE